MTVIRDSPSNTFPILHYNNYILYILSSYYSRPLHVTPSPSISSLFQRILCHPPYPTHLFHYHTRIVISLYLLPSSIISFTQINIFLKYFPLHLLFSLSLSIISTLYFLIIQSILSKVISNLSIHNPISDKLSILNIH